MRIIIHFIFRILNTWCRAWNLSQYFIYVFNFKRKIIVYWNFHTKMYLEYLNLSISFNLIRNAMYVTRDEKKWQCNCIDFDRILNKCNRLIQIVEKTSYKRKNVYLQTPGFFLLAWLSWWNFLVEKFSFYKYFQQKY